MTARVKKNYKIRHRETGLFLKRRDGNISFTDGGELWGSYSAAVDELHWILYSKSSTTKSDINSRMAREAISKWEIVEIVYQPIITKEYDLSQAVLDTCILKMIRADHINYYVATYYECLMGRQRQNDINFVFDFRTARAGANVSFRDIEAGVRPILKKLGLGKPDVIEKDATWGFADREQAMLFRLSLPVEPKVLVYDLDKVRTETKQLLGLAEIPPTIRPTIIPLSDQLIPDEIRVRPDPFMYAKDAAPAPIDERMAQEQILEELMKEYAKA